MVSYPAALPRKGVAGGDSVSRAEPWGFLILKLGKVHPMDKRDLDRFVQFLEAI